MRFLQKKNANGSLAKGKQIAGEKVKLGWDSARHRVDRGHVQPTIGLVKFISDEASGPPAIKGQLEWLGGLETV